MPAGRLAAQWLPAQKSAQGHGMRPQVALHVVGLGEAAAAHLAAEWLFPGVDTLMVLQLVAVGEALAAVVAGVGLLTRVHALVPPQGRELGEGLPADVASEQRSSSSAARTWGCVAHAGGGRGRGGRGEEVLMAA